MYMERHARYPFPMSRMIEELKGMILLQGDYIWLTSGRAAAENYIGFEIPEDEDCLSLMSSATHKIDLDRFLIADWFEEAYAFAFPLKKVATLEDGILPRLRAYVSNMPRVRIYPLLEEQPIHPRFPSSYCKATVDMAWARWKLEIERQGAFSLRELGLLANVDHQAVRADIRNGRLKAVADAKPMAVSFEEAKRWLLEQPGFKTR